MSRSGWEQRLARTLAGQGAQPLLVLVEGVAGSGKSRLVQALTRQHASVETSLILRFAPEGSLAVHGRPRGDSTDPARELVAVAEGTRTTLVVVEDVHRSDEQSAALLRRLLAAPRPDLAVVLTYRPEELDLPLLPLGDSPAYAPSLVIRRVVLAPLTEDDVQQLAHAALGPERCSPGLVTRLHKQAGGNPQVVVDLLGILGDSDLGEAQRYDVGSLDEAGVPVRLVELIASRTARLDKEHHPIIWAAAVLGEPAGMRELSDVAGMDHDRSQAALLAALGAAVLQECDHSCYGFAGPLAATAMREALPGPLRADLHRRAADVLGHRHPVPWLKTAEHRALGGPVNAWLRAVERAAQVCARTGRHQEAIAPLAQALASPSVSAKARARLAPMLASSAQAALRSDETEHVLRRIVEDTELPPEVRGAVRRDLGLLLSNQLGRGVQGWREMQTAVDELAERPGLAARVMAALALPYWPGASLEENLTWLKRAEEAARAGDETVRTAVAVNRMTALISIGDPAGWQDLDDLPGTSKDPAILLHLARGRCNAAEASLWLGYCDRTAALAREGMEMALRAGAPYIEHTAQGSILVLDWMTGRWAGLAARAQAFIAETEDMPVLVGDARLVDAMLALARGEWRQATASLTGSLDDAAAPLAAATSAALVRLALARQQDQTAAAEASAAWSRLRRKGVWVWGSELAPWAVTAALAVGENRIARELVEEFAQGISGRDAPAAQAALLWCRAILTEHCGHPLAAGEQYTAASLAYAALPRPYTAALCAEAAGTSALARGDEDTAVKELDACAERFDALNATWDTARVRSALRTRKPSGKPRTLGRPSYGTQLSPREEEVARLAASGLTNRDIAHTLHLSVRTVEQHVANAMRKLNVTSRVALTRVTPPN
ncbi:LuxR C-terminal-related transcriptional regulator [Streptomyces altiplanensis]